MELPLGQFENRVVDGAYMLWREWQREGDPCYAIGLACVNDEDVVIFASAGYYDQISAHQPIGRLSWWYR